jgi:PadR family transcriptional regulator, regulatory protein PadR
MEEAPWGYRTMSAVDLSGRITQLRRGVLELCILHTLTPEASYGYEIVTKLEPYGPLAAGPNTVYPLLRRLKAEGLLATFTRASPSGPPRQYYRITAEGRRYLASFEREWQALARAVNRLVSEGLAA